MWEWFRAPGARALHKALRVAAAATAGFVLGRYVIDDPQTAVYATLVPIALLGLGEVGGAPAARARAYAAAVVAAAAMTAVGTLTSDDTLAASLTLFAGALVISQAGIAGGNAVGLSRAVLLVLVVSSGIPVPDSALPDRMLGLAIGSALAVAAALLLWPDRSDVGYRRRLGAAIEPLADWASGTGASTREQVAAALADARPFALGATERPIGAAAVAFAERLLASGIEQLAELQARLGDGSLHAADREVLREVGGALGGAAAVLRDPRAGPPDPERLERARRRYIAASEATLAQLLVRGAPADELERAFDTAFRLRRVAAISAAVAGQARVAAGVDHRAAIPGVPPRSAASRLAGQVRIRLTLDSVLVRNGLRLALGLAAARAVAGAFDLEHGFWVVFATLTVLRASARGTRANAARALLGTAIGAAVATALLFAFEAEDDVYVLLLPLFAFAAVYGSALSFVAGQVGFTLLIVAIFNLIAPPQWNIGLIRLEDVAIGAAVGLVVGVAAWPRGPAAQMRRSFAGAIDAGAAYTRAVAHGLLHRSGTDTEPARRKALWAARRAEDVLTAHLEEVGDREATLERWTALLERTHGLWYEAGVMVTGVDHRDGNACPRLAAALDDATDRVVEGFRDAAAALRGGGPLGPPPPDSPHSGELGTRSLACAASVAGTRDRERLAAVVDLFGVRVWILELLNQLGAVRSHVRSLA